MKVKILNLDFRKSENRDIIQEELRKIKPFRKCQEGQNISFEKLEKCIMVLCRNYDMTPRIYSDCFSSNDGIIWTFQLIDNKNLNEIGKCYGLSLYELMCKSVIMSYDITRKREKKK